MNKMPLLLFIGFLCRLALCVGMQNPLLEKFAKTYAPPNHIVTFIEQNKTTILNLQYQNGNSAFGKMSECPEIYFKGIGIERLINAERMRSCIERYKLTNLDVAKKYVYCLNGYWIVIAQTIEPATQPSNITLSEFKQLYELAKRTGYWDWNWEDGYNWIRDTQGRLVCCDTEDDSFCKEKSSRAWVYHYLYDQMWKKTELFGPGVLSYAEKQKKKLIGLQEYVTPLQMNTQYDDPEIDFEEVKKLVRK